ncbi:hypothetical protein V2J09_010497 [Rumex salicifolius]
MAEGFELYHVPQQSRRDKLRVNTSSTAHLPLTNHSNSFQFQPTNILTTNNHHHQHQQQQQQQAGGLLVPFYDPSLHLDLLTCAAGHGLIHPQSSHLLASSEPNIRSENPSVIIKGEGTSFMGFLGNPQNQTNNSSYSSPSLIDPNNNPHVFYAASHNREFGHSQGLSLSLSSHSNNNNNSSSNNNTHLPMELNFQYSAPPGPFTGYTSVLKGSIYLRPAQHLLQEICDVGRFCSGDKLDPDLSLLDPPSVESHPGLDDSDLSDSDGVGAQTKSRLISMLDEVYGKYKQYYQQVQAVVASFESIPGLNSAAPFANFALKALSKHFKCLKAAITDQLRFMSKPPGSISGRKHGYQESGENDKFVLYSQRQAHSSARFIDNQPVWRPQRGLPERAVSVLRSWLFEHFLHPYPTDTDKMMLAKQTGLSRSQVSNWFINARVRIWKPMVEEIHSLETQQKASSSSSKAEPNQDHHNTRMTPSSSGQNVPPEKRVRNELVSLAHHHENPQMSMDHYARHFAVGNGVSLTLALHQNSHRMNGLLDPFRYGLQTDGEECMVGPSGFEAQARHFSSRDVMGGGQQLLHDFVDYNSRELRRGGMFVTVLNCH